MLAPFGTLLVADATEAADAEVGVSRMLAPDGEDAEQDPGIALDGGLDAIEWGATDVPPDDSDGDPVAP